jgi:hypothetical protein
VTVTPFGTSSTGLLQRLRPARVTAADVRDVAVDLLPTLSRPGLHLALVERAGAGSDVVVEEDERHLRVRLTDLADDMTAAGVRPAPDAVATALSAWVTGRPVTDAAAAATGLAVLDWTDGRCTAIGWRVVVRRGDRALPWAPSSSVGAAQVQRTRSAALCRSSDVPLDLRVEGPVALWSHDAVPLLATAALVAPERMRERAAGEGLAMDDMHVVVTPDRPVACAGPAVAARLAGETPEPCVILPAPGLAALRWT